MTKKQIEKFRETAKELECNESEKEFDRKLGRLVKKRDAVSGEKLDGK